MTNILRPNENDDLEVRDANDLENKTIAEYFAQIYRGKK